MSVTHYAELQEDGVHLANYPLCGQANAHRTNGADAVTCKRCLKELTRLSSGAEEAQDGRP